MTKPGPMAVFTAQVATNWYSAMSPTRPIRGPRRALWRTMIVLVSLLVSSLGLQGFSIGAAHGAPLYPEDPNLSPILVRVAVDSTDVRAATVNLLSAQRRLADAENRFAVSQAQIGDLALAQARLTAEFNEATRRRDKTQNRLALIQAGLKQVAIENYMRGGMATTAVSDIDLDMLTEMRKNRVVLETVNSNHIADARATAELLERSDSTLASTRAELENLQKRHADTTSARDQALADGKTAREDVARYAGEFSKARLEAQVIGLGTGEGAEWGIGFQLVALDAYMRASAKVNEERPGCNLRWQVIAGFARVESAHGTYLGRHVGADGQVSEDVIGIALDGNNKTAVIRDTDGGAIDGDTAYDRAVGPLAFIPAAWRQYGRDGNGDDKADPQNIYDGALATANLICSHGFALDNEEGLRRAAFSYNRSTVYVDMVVGFVERYDKFAIPA